MTIFVITKVEQMNYVNILIRNFSRLCAVSAYHHIPNVRFKLDELKKELNKLAKMDERGMFVEDE